MAVTGADLAKIEAHVASLPRDELLARALVTTLQLYPTCGYTALVAGTDKWVFAHRLTDGLRRDGYEFAFSPAKVEKLNNCFRAGLCAYRTRQELGLC